MIGKGQTAGLLILIGVLAALLRWWALDYGLPAVYNPDEVAIMSRALAFSSGDLNPHNFLYPTFFFYLLFAWVGAYFVLGTITGLFASLGDFERQFFHDPSQIYMAGRLLGLAFGTVTIYLTYLITRRLFDRRTGLAAAWFLAIAPIHVQDSHYVKHDVALTTLVVLAYIAMARIWPLGRLTTSGVAWAGAAVGLAISTHYYAVFLVIPFVLAIWLAEKGSGLSFDHDGVARAWKRLLLGGGVALMTFLVCSPFVLLEYQTAWRDIVANRQIVVDRVVSHQSSYLPSAGAYLKMIWSYGVGWPVALLSVVGVVWLAFQAPARAVWLGSFGIAFLLFLANTVPGTRRLNPVLPTLCLFAAVGVTRLATSITRSRRSLAATVIVGAVAIPGLQTSMALDRFFARDDTRTIALGWIEAHIPAGETILVQPYSVPLAESTTSLREALEANLGDASRASRKFQKRLAIGDPPRPTYRLFYLGEGGLDADKRYLTYAETAGRAGHAQMSRLGIRYIVLKRYNRPDAATVPFLESLRESGRRIATFSPYRHGVGTVEQTEVEPYLHNTDAWLHPALERPGPVIEIWILTAHDLKAS